MPFLPLRPVPVADAAKTLYQEWLAWLRESLDEADCDRNELVRTILTDIYFPQFAGVDLSTLPASTSGRRPASSIWG